MGDRVKRVRRRFKESNLLIQSESSEAILAAVECVRANRRVLRKYIALHPNFQHTLRPVSVGSKAPRLVRVMAEATCPLNIGPMAAVAGALADLAVEAMLNTQAEIAVVENGGEISASSKETINVGLYTGKTGLGGRMGFQIKPSECPLGIGTSSATVGHAFSLGEADAVTVFSDTAASADAAATAICNRVKGSGVEETVNKGLKMAEGLDFLRGALIVRSECVGVVGRIPQLIRIEGESHLKYNLRDTASTIFRGGSGAQ